jgi:O-antigen ligase
MKFSSSLWFLVWGGMFTGIYALQDPGFLSSPLGLFQGVRALLPICAAYICSIWILGNRSRFPYSKSPLAFMLYYCFLGIISSFFLSPNKINALYWAGVYLSPFLVVWVTLDQKDAFVNIQRLIQINYYIFIFLTVTFFPQAFSAGFGKISHNEFYTLPLNLGEIRSNGVGRYALVVSIISAVRFLMIKKKSRYFWLALGFPSLFLLFQTQSRTALLGLAVVAALFVLIRGADWRLIFIGPLASYLVWLSGIKWRAHGQVSQIVLLSGREYTWQKGLEMIKQSPFLGWGFNADRLLMNSEHMHNSYLHSMIHSGILGALLFLAAIIGIWALVFRKNLIRIIRTVGGSAHVFLVESILIIGFLTSRSFFESTAAFYGVDLLLIVPSITYIMIWISKSALENKPQEGSHPTTLYVGKRKNDPNRRI